MSEISITLKLGCAENNTVSFIFIFNSGFLGSHSLQMDR